MNRRCLLPRHCALEDAWSTDVNLTLTVGDLGLIIGAFECYENWELGRNLFRYYGPVFLLGDFLGAADRYWPSEPSENFGIDSPGQRELAGVDPECVDDQ